MHGMGVNHRGLSSRICYCPDHFRHAHFVFLCSSCELVLFNALWCVVYKGVAN